MKALSLLQPWATLIAIGAKRIETRSWSTNYRGPLAIHAGKAFPAATRAMSLQAPFVEELLVGGVYGTRDLPLGAIVAVCTLADCEPIGGKYLVGEPERSFGDFSPGRFAWRLEDVRRLDPPIPANGALSLWEWPGDET